MAMLQTYFLHLGLQTYHTASSSVYLSMKLLLHYRLLLLAVKLEEVPSSEVASFIAKEKLVDFDKPYQGVVASIEELVLIWVGPSS